MYAEAPYNECGETQSQSSQGEMRGQAGGSPPTVAAETGNMGADAGKNMLAIREAQANAATQIQPQGSAAFVSTTDFARPKELSPNVGHGHHWFGNAESYFLIGDAMGNAMTRLMKNRRAN